MKFKSFFVVLFLTGIVEAERRNPYGIQLTGIKCDYGPVCENTVCNIKPINRTTTLMTFGCQLIKPLTWIKLRVEAFKKSSSNVFHPWTIRFEIDYCEFMSGKDSVITDTFAKSFEFLRKNAKPCPVSGRHMFENYPFDSSILPSTLLPTGEYRFDNRQIIGRNETVFYVQMFVKVKNPFF